MYEYRIVKAKNGLITATINTYAEDGWEIVGLTDINTFGATTSYELVFERDVNYVHHENEYEYMCLKPQGRYIDFMEDKSKAGWRVVAYTGVTTFGATGTPLIVFKRKK